MGQETECAICTELLLGEDLEDPRHYHGEAVCEGCYYDHQFTCCLCEGYESDEYQHVLLVVQKQEEADPRVPDGVYAIVGSPYFWSDIIDGGLFPKVLAYVCAVPADVDLGGYGCGHLCRQCQETMRIKVWIAKARFLVRGFFGRFYRRHLWYPLYRIKRWARTLRALGAEPQRREDAKR